MNRKIKTVEFKDANNRCVCGKCQHQIVKVILDKGDEWFPTNTEMMSIKEIGRVVTRHNLDTDKFCFRAPKQEFNIIEVFE